MNYLLNRNTRPGRRFFTRFVLFLCAVLFFLVFAVWYPDILRSALSVIAAPIWRTGSALGGGVQTIAAHFRLKQALIKEVEELREREMEREAILSAYGLVLDENQKLKQNFGRDKTEKRILAAVLASPPRAPYDTIIIDAGTEEGISVGDDVLFGETVLGRVAVVSKKTATVELFSTASVKTPITIWRGGVAVPGEAVGEGGGAFRVTLPKEVGVMAGDLVVMPGINPKQFANVVVVEESITDSFATAYLRNPVRAEFLPFLEVRAR